MWEYLQLNWKLTMMDRDIFPLFHTISSSCYSSLPIIPSPLCLPVPLSFTCLFPRRGLPCWAPPGVVSVGCVCTMASLLRVVSATCSAPLFSGVSCVKLQSGGAIKSSGLRFFRTHQALGRCASPGNTQCTHTVIWHGQRNRTIYRNHLMLHYCK